MRKLLTISVALAFLTLVAAPFVYAKDVGKKAINLQGAAALRHAKTDKLAQAVDEPALKRLPSQKRANRAAADAVVFSENFDGATTVVKFADLWNVSNSWHVSTTGAFAGKSYWAGDAALGGYDDGDARSLTSPAIALPSGSSPTLTFMHRYSVEAPGGEPAGFNGWDIVNVRVSTDGTTFNVVTPSGGPAYNVSSAYSGTYRYGANVAGWGGSSGAYVSSTVNLSSFAGQTIYIRFELLSDRAFSTEDDPTLFGWRVDNIVVAAGGTTIFSDDAGDTGTAQFVAGGPKSLGSSWAVTNAAAVSAPNSAGFRDPATGNYTPTSLAGIVTPAIAIDKLPSDTGKLIADFQIRGTLDPTVGPNSEARDAFLFHARAYSGGHWSFWQEATFVSLPATFTSFTDQDFSALIGVADSVQFRLIGYSYADAAVVAPANIFVDDITLTAIAIQNDIAAVNVAIPFPAKVGDALTLTLNVANTGINPQSNVQWQGSIIDVATNTQVASVVGARAAAIAPGTTVAIPSVNTWTPSTPGIYRVRAFTRLATDEDRSNDTTNVANDDASTLDNIFGPGQEARHSPFVVHDTRVLFSAALHNLPASPTPSQLLTAGLLLRSAPDPGVVTWQTTVNAEIADANGAPGYRGAYILFDSLGRPQDEELIVPNLDFSFITSNAILAFKGIGTAGFTGGYTRFSIGVSSDNGHTWSDVFERRRGIDPQTGQNFGGAVFFLGSMTPGRLDITRWAAGRSNVWVRFRYEGINDGDWLIWGVAVSGRGLQAANVTGVADIPKDQGKQVRVSWTRSANDGQLQGVPITHYGIWRQVAGNNSPAPFPGEVIQVANRSAMLASIDGLKPGARLYEIEAAQAWDFIGSVVAHSDPDYNFVAPTLADSVQTCFMVSAHTANPLVFANSNTACGTSFDNLPPDAPGKLAATIQNGAALLTWQEPANEEPAFYSIYRSETSGSYGAPFAKTADRQFQVDRTKKYYYVVTATDYGSNQSAFSNEIVVLITGVEDRPTDAIPTAYALEQNYPNPFNPQTTIEFALVERGKVTLTIYDMMGQEVEKLVEARLPSGGLGREERYLRGLLLPPQGEQFCPA
jgi:hypothetical protein